MSLVTTKMKIPSQQPSFKYDNVAQMASLKGQMCNDENNRMFPSFLLHYE